jgi:hypothetical protein
MQAKKCDIFLNSDRKAFVEISSLHATILYILSVYLLSMLCIIKRGYYLTPAIAAGAANSVIGADQKHGPS